MSARAIVSGALHKAAEERTSKPGKRFASLHENVNSSTRWWRVVAFDEASIAAVLSLRVGEPIAVSGEINAELWRLKTAASRAFRGRLPRTLF